MILVLNCGSQSIKWKIFTDKLKLFKAGSRDVFNSDEFENILSDELNKITEDITLVGHRVVHGGQTFRRPLKITEENLQELEKINHFAPLHNPYNLLGIKVCQKIFQSASHFAVFDTEFFASLPEKAYTYALPKNIVEENGFRRYGFQGTSHQYVAQEAAKIIKKPFNKIKIITVHLGGGASVTAIKNGKAIDTTMGFTPLEGLVMMTRSGSIDPAIVLELVKKYGVEGTDKILNKDSGIKGISGAQNMLELFSALGGPASGGEERIDPEKKRRAKLAFDVFVYSIQKQIGAYYAVLGGCDALVFTGSIGAGNPKTKNSVMAGIKDLKIKKVVAIKTDEELAIAQKIKRIK